MEAISTSGLDSAYFTESSMTRSCARLSMRWHADLIFKKPKNFNSPLAHFADWRKVLMRDFIIQQPLRSFHKHFSNIDGDSVEKKAPAQNFGQGLALRQAVVIRQIQWT